MDVGDEASSRAGLDAGLTGTGAGQRAREEQRLLGRHFRQLADIIPEFLYLGDVGEPRRMLFVSRGFEKIWGRPCEQLIRNPALWFEALHEEDRQRCTEAWERHVRTGEDYELEYRIRRPDGEIRWVHARETLVPDESGRRMRAAGMAWDITDRKVAELALRDGEEHFRLTFDQSPIGAAIVGLDFRFLAVNDEFCRITGFSREEMLAKGFPEITHPDDLEADVRQAQAMIGGQIDQYKMDKRYIHKDGSTVWVRLSARMVRHPDGRPRYFLPMVESIHERKQAEQAAREREQTLQHIFEASPGALYEYEMTADGRHRFLLVSPRIEHLLDVTAGQLMADASAGWRNVHPEDRVGLRDSTLRSARTGEPWQYDFRHARPDGTVRWLRGHSLPRKAADGSTVWTGVFTDITELHGLLERAEEDALIKQNLLRELNHRVKNNLATIAGFLQMERAKPDGDRIGFIDSLLQRIQGLTQLHLLLSEDATGSVDASLLIRRVAEAAVYNWPPPQPRLELSFASDGVRVASNRAGAIAMLASELITNALRHGLAGAQGACLRVSFAAGPAGGVLSVADNGVGLPAGFNLDRDAGAGIKVIRFILHKQLHGVLELTRAAGWTTAKARFAGLHDPAVP
jgi:PAS domain S-box-containing protein